MCGPNGQEAVPCRVERSQGDLYAAVSIGSDCLANADDGERAGSAGSKDRHAARHEGIFEVDGDARKGPRGA
jgi:hypothetical protein